MMQAIVERGVGEIGDARQLAPRRRSASAICRQDRAPTLGEAALSHQERRDGAQALAFPGPALQGPKLPASRTSSPGQSARMRDARIMHLCYKSHSQFSLSKPYPSAYAHGAPSGDEAYQDRSMPIGIEAPCRLKLSRLFRRRHQCKYGFVNYVRPRLSCGTAEAWQVCGGSSAISRKPLRVCSRRI